MPDTQRQTTGIAQENLMRSRALDAIRHGNLEEAQRVVDADHGRTLTLDQVFRLYQSELETQATQLRDSQHRTEQALDWFTHLFRALPVAAVLVNEQGGVTDANDHAMDELGLRQALRTLPVPLRRLMSTPEAELRLLAMLARAAHGPTEGPTEGLDDVALRTLGGEPRWADLRLTRLPDFGPAGSAAHTRSARFLCVFSDRTTRVEAQRAREMAQAAEHQRDRALSASQAKTQLLSRVSHELRTPLNAVLGFSQLLLAQAEPLAAQSRERIGYIRRAGEHLLALVDEVLEINQAESGQLKLDTSPVALATLIQEVLNLQQPAAQRQDVALRFEPETGPPAVALADARRVREVLNNLVSNGIKYNVRGGWLQLRTGADAQQVWVAVVDGGIGMTAAQLEHLFEPFNRLGAERLHIQGHGLGLSIARGLAQAMGGTLEISSEPGTGTCCTLRLPRAADATS
ncbi:MAG: PAS domain-containing sensor histidine kinase [Rubrivivax sp.]|nr:PAS domain-containing sensor histidine kinase [Rubrivivax sp.]